MTLHSDNDHSFNLNLWAVGVVEQLKALKVQLETGLKDVQAAILQLALTNAEVNRLREETDKLDGRVRIPPKPGRALRRDSVKVDGVDQWFSQNTTKARKGIKTGLHRELGQGDSGGSEYHQSPEGH